MATTTRKIFISSPGDVGTERVLAGRVLERLANEFRGRAQIEPVMWEHEPLRATGHFQEQIVLPSDCDVVVCILWSRLGTRLPEGFRREDGSAYLSGTEFEFEDAAKSHQERGIPDLLVYRKTATPVTDMADPERALLRIEQKRALDTFLDRWFGQAHESFQAAFHTFASPQQFEQRLEEHLRKLIKEKLPPHVGSDDQNLAEIHWPSGTSPYRGLERFEFEHHQVFSGRLAATAAAKDALVRQAASGPPFVLILGMSGCGKSSLARAGVLPLLTTPGVIEGVGLWRWCILRPSDSPHDLCDGLAGALVGTNALPEFLELGYDRAELASLLREAPQRVVTPLNSALCKVAETAAEAENLPYAPQTRLALVVDQLEELFSQSAVDGSQRSGFVEALSALVRSGCVWVVATMRSDHYHRLRELPELVRLKEGHGQYDLGPPDFSEIEQMIRLPAFAAGLRFEVDPSTRQRLDQVIHRAALSNPAALALLEFTLHELFQRRTAEGILTFDAYRRLGGLEGAIAERAESVYAGLDLSVQQCLPWILRHLVTIGAAGETTSQRATLTSLQQSTESKNFLEAFMAARLLVTHAGDQGPTLELAHEALLTYWPRAAQLVAKDVEFFRVRARIVAAEQRWQDENCPQDLLLPPGKPLAEAEHVITYRPGDLAQNLVEYIGTSVGIQRRHQRHRRILVTSAILLLLTAIVGAVLVRSQFAQNKLRLAQEQSRLAQERAAHLSQEVAHYVSESRSTDTGQVLSHLKILHQNIQKNAEITAGEKAHTLATLRDTAIATLALVGFKQERRIQIPRVHAHRFSFADDLQQYVFAPKAGALFRSAQDSADSAAIGPLGGMDLKRILADPASRLIALEYYSKENQKERLLRFLERSETDSDNFTLLGEKKGNYELRSRLNSLVASCERGETGLRMHLDDMRQKRRFTPTKIDQEPYQMQIRPPDGAAVAITTMKNRRTAPDSPVVLIWDTKNNTRKPFITGAAPIRRMAWGMNGMLLAVGYDDGRCELFNGQTGRPISSWQAHAGQIRMLRFYKSSELLFSSAWDDRIHLWDSVAKRPLVSIPYFADRIDVNRAGTRFAFRFLDRAYFYRLHFPGIRRTLPGPGGPTWAMDVHPSGQLLALAGGRGVCVWDLRNWQQIFYTDKTGSAASAFFHPAGKTLLTYGSGGLMQWLLETAEDGHWSVLDQPQLLRPPSHTDGHRISPVRDGKIAIVASGSQLQVIDDLSQHLPHGPDGLQQIQELLQRWPSIHNRISWMFPIPEKDAVKTQEFSFSRPNWVDLSPDGSWLGATDRREDTTKARVWNIASRERWDLECGGIAVKRLWFSPDGAHVVTGSKEKYLLWQTGDFHQEHEISHGSTQPSVAFSPNGNLMAAAAQQGIVSLYQMHPQFIRLANLTSPHQGKIHWLNFTPDSSGLFVASDGGIVEYWDLARLRSELRKLALEW